MLVALTANIASALSSYPHTLSYFNELAGGPLNGPAHLLDANVDWGQDLLEVMRFVNQHADAKSLRMSYFGCSISSLAGIDATRVLHLDNDVVTINLTPGWYAVSISHVLGYKYNGFANRILTSFQRIDPAAHCGYSIRVYQLTSDQALQAQLAAPVRASGVSK